MRTYFLDGVYIPHKSPSNLQGRKIHKGFSRPLYIWNTIKSNKKRYTLDEDELEKADKCMPYYEKMYKHRI